MSASELGCITLASLPWSPFASSVSSSSVTRSKWLATAFLLRPMIITDVVDAGRDRLFDDVLDRRLVDDGEHLLRHRLGGGKEAGAKAGRGNDGLDGGKGHEVDRIDRM